MQIHNFKFILMKFVDSIDSILGGMLDLFSLYTLRDTTLYGTCSH